MTNIKYYLNLRRKNKEREYLKNQYRDMDTFGEDKQKCMKMRHKKTKNTWKNTYNIIEKIDLIMPRRALE